MLSKVGGLEIAGLVGVILGAAKHRCPVVVDGFISSAAALVASRLAPLSASYMLASHLSQEQGHAKLLESVGLAAMLQMDMRLGEGTGAVLAVQLDRCRRQDHEGNGDIRKRRRVAGVGSRAVREGGEGAMAVLVTGGARSGKSSFAEKLAMHGSERGIYIATSHIYDEEMRERVELHQQMRLALGVSMGYPRGAVCAARAAHAAAGERRGCCGVGRLFDTMADELAALLRG